jgi:hypothetical protein
MQSPVGRLVASSCNLRSWIKAGLQVGLNEIDAREAAILSLIEQEIANGDKVSAKDHPR